MIKLIKRRRRSRVLADGYPHVVDQLRRVSPEVAAALEADPPALIKSARTQPLKPATPQRESDQIAPQAGQRKGVVFTSPELLHLLQEPETPQALARAVEGQGIDPSSPAAMADLRVKNFYEFWQTTTRALTQDPGHAVTPEKATGNYFEIVGWDDPVIRTLRWDLFETYRSEVHAIADRGGRLRNGVFEDVELLSPFKGPILTMENTRLIIVVGERELNGGQWVDRLDHVTNQHEQTLGSFADLKGVSSSKDLKKQIGSLHPRLLAAIAYGGNVYIEGIIRGKRERIKLSQFVFPNELDAGTLSRVGVKATRGETQYGLETVKDVHGDPFILMVLHCPTDTLRRIYTSFYLELGL